MKEGAIVCDVGSVKGQIARLGHESLHGKATFVGAHPMAGSEKTGWEHSRADLFEGEDLLRHADRRHGAGRRPARGRLLAGTSGPRS